MPLGPECPAAHLPPTLRECHEYPTRHLLPEGLSASPYDVLEFDATLTLHDPQGMRATFARTQRLRVCRRG